MVILKAIIKRSLILLALFCLTLISIQKANAAIFDDTNTFSVIVPTALPVFVDSDGEVFVSSENQIINNSLDSRFVEVSSVYIEPLNGWSLVNYGVDFSREKVNLKLFGFQINGVGAREDGSCYADFEDIPPCDYINFDYNVKVAAQDYGITKEQIANVVFIVGWTDDKVLSYEITSSDTNINKDGVAIINVGDSAQLYALSSYPLEPINEGWSVEDRSILSVSNSGVIRGREPGETYVTYTNRGITVTIKVIVLAPLESISVTPKYIEMYVGDTCRLNVTYEPSNTTDDKTVTWSSSDRSVASVKNGVVTANKTGEVYITAQVGNCSDYAVIIVSGARAGLYDENDNLICPWEESGIIVDKDYNMNDIWSTQTHAWYVINNKYSNTRKIVLPNNISFLGDYSLAYLSNVRHIVMSNSIKELNTSVFENCSNLTYMELSNKLEIIGDKAFAYCCNMLDLDMPDTVNYIGDNAFQNCSNLRTVKLNENIKYIGSYSFFCCNNLNNLYFYNALISIGDYAFKDCTQLLNVYYVGSETLWNKIEKGVGWNDGIPGYSMTYNVEPNQ